MQVNVLEAKNRLSQLIRRAQAGEEVVITNRGAPVARLLPAGAANAQSVGDARTILGWLESHPLPAYARRSAREIDASVEEERRAWD
jgi:prevent-host-death family protein